MSLLPRIAAGFLIATLLASAALAVEGDVVYERKVGDSETPVGVFPHWIHRIRYRCYACHPNLFEMKAGANSVTMADMIAGKSCGACHNGTIAWGITFDTCNRCHVGE